MNGKRSRQHLVARKPFFVTFTKAAKPLANDSLNGIDGELTIDADGSLAKGRSMGHVSRESGVA